MSLSASPASSAKSKTHSFFSNPFSSRPPPPPPLIRLPSSSLPTPIQSAANTSSSRNDSFFFASTNLYDRPTPPPSIRSRSNRSSLIHDDSSPLSQAIPLSRFFPSRSSTLPSNKHSDEQRDFVDIDDDVSSTSGHGHDRFFNPSSYNPSTPPSSVAQDLDPAVDDNIEEPPLSPTSSLKTSLSHHSTSLHPPPSFDPPLPSPTLTHLEVALSTPFPELTPNTSLEAPFPLTLVRQVGVGSFSEVWLASDDSGHLRGLGRRGTRKGKRLESQSWARRRRDGGVEGLRPGGGSGSTDADGLKRSGSIFLRSENGNGGGEPPPPRNLVALKLLSLSLCAQDPTDRTRISFVREVEVLRHIYHPSIITYLHSFTSQMYHALVLEYCPGGDLVEVLNDDDNYNNLTEKWVRRVWSEMGRALGWMHSVGVVHRDVKLENILLTQSFDPRDIPPPSVPLVKLTDFNLSRFVSLSSPLLTTKCGSESYAAPEIIIGESYDGRETDAWALGVVLYAIIVRKLPFAPDNKSREEELRKIARGEWTLPSIAATAPTATGESLRRDLITESLERVLSRLLVRNSRKRARLDNFTEYGIWHEDWLYKAEEEGGLPLPLSATLNMNSASSVGSSTYKFGGETDNIETNGYQENEEGELVDEDGIDGIVRREV